MDKTAKPTVSLIMPVYNAAAYLPRAVAAVTGQTLTDWELILVDDGSTDGSPALCDRLAAADRRVRVIHQPNRGAGAARNAGMDAARGDYLMFPDADDICEPEQAAALLEAARRFDADVAVCGYRSFDAAGERERICPERETLLEGADAVRRWAAGWFPEGLAGYPWNKLYRAAFLRERRLRFSDMRRFQDGVFNLDVFDRAGRVCLLPRPLYRYKINDLTGLFQKFPPQMFDLLRGITDAFYDKLERWGLRDPSYERRIRPFFLNGAVGCVDCAYSPAWGMDRRARRDYWRMLAADETLRRCAAAPEADEGLSRYAALVVRLLAAGHFTRLGAAVRLKLFMKKNLGRLFFRLKEV